MAAHSASATVRVDLPVVLPEIEDERDACVQRLQALLEAEAGVDRTHLVKETSMLCVHYNPVQLTLDRVQSLVRTAGATVHELYGHRIWPIRAVAAEDSGRRIEDLLGTVDGVLTTSVNLAGQTVRVEFERARFNPNDVEATLRGAGFAPEVTAGQKPSSWVAGNRELAWSLASGVLMAAGAGLGYLGGTRGAAVALYAGAYVCGAYDLLTHLWASLRKGRFVFDIDLLMLLAALGAASLDEWAEGAFLLFLFSLAHALEHSALGRARASIRQLSDLAPAMAEVDRGGRYAQVPVLEVRPGEQVLIRPSMRVPVDGRVVAGRSAVDQAPITGESVPVEKGAGDQVFAGTINGEGALTVETVSAVGDRTLDRIVTLVEEAQTQKAPTQVFTERFERLFVPCVLVADVLVVVLPPLFGVWDWSTSFYRGMALLVASSPCALALGTPATVLAGIAQAARRGVLIKGGMHLENLGTVRAIALDKTGTLTVGRPEVTDIVSVLEGGETRVLQLGAAVERQSQHPLAVAVVRRAESAGLASLDAQDVQSVVGRGVRARVDGQIVEIGNLRLFDEQGVTVPDALRSSVEGLQGNGRSVMVLRAGEQWIGALGVADQPRANVGDVLNRLRRAGMQRIVMVTGDHQNVGDAIGREVGVDDVRGGLLPEDKVTAVRALAREHGGVAMVGDGVNDAPALAQATVGIAMGAAGTATALETADVALMADDLTRLPFAIGLSRKARAVIRQNLYVSLAVIAVLIAATTTGTFGIGPAVVVHEGSTLIVIANSLRLLMFEDR